jgi:hypothetical protein
MAAGKPARAAENPLVEAQLDNDGSSGLVES